MNRPDNPGVRVPPPLIAAASIVAGLALDGRLGQPLPGIGAPQAIGLAAGLCALVLIASALGLFYRRGTAPEPWRAASKLVIQGPYRFTRNPMYLGLLLLSLAVALYFLSWATAATAVVTAIIIDRAVIPREEAYLLRRFGADYASYQSQVRRWL